MNEAAGSIKQLERRVMLRKRLLSLQDAAALGLTIGGLISTAMMLLILVTPIAVPRWPVLLVGLGIPLCFALTRWFLTRMREQEAAFAIDEALHLEDRVATAHVILKRGGPDKMLQEALIEDAAARIANHAAATIVPFTMRRWHALAVISLITVGVALMIPPRSSGVSETSVAERADIRSSGERLEQVAAEVEQTVPLETETARLAKEQGELGRVFRQSQATRVEALQRLSALEERIRARHDDLERTRADEIVSLAEQRLRHSLSASVEARSANSTRPQSALDDSLAPAESSRQAGKPRSRVRKQRSEPSVVAKTSPDSREATPQSGAHNKAEIKPGDQESAKAPESVLPQKQPREPLSGGASRPGLSRMPAATEPRADPTPEEKMDGQKPAALKGDADAHGTQNPEGQNPDSSPKTDRPGGALDALKALPDSLTEQAARALPKLSEDLLKKAAELRANQLTPDDVEKLRQAAEALSRNLEPIAQSQALRQALVEMARQVTAEQIERVARELGNQENLKQELEAAARLLAENQRAKEMVAGLARQVERLRDEAHAQRVGDQMSRHGEPPSSRQQVTGEGVVKPGKSEAVGRRLEGKGSVSNAAAKLQLRAGGEYLYLKTQAGSGAARAPYSGAYPRYRREAERSVERTRVPPALRSVVRKYFDAINPDAKR
ncbi:MAG TPA: hypothetical protein VLM38_23950 [Blastocatellia bacterium]|nr:hypothetical protein [Blastocatellia bacterium]